MTDLFERLDREAATVADASRAPDRRRTTRPGVRLMAVEVYNWGTFDKSVWRLDLGGGNGLLTGQNGAGKSTLVDAITTLLVPARRITYNKAGQADRDERDPRSYVLGTYKSERSHTGSAARPVSLREPGSTYSVILGRFHNAAFDETTTLAQVFWFKEPQGQPARFFVVAEGSLSIETDFTGFGRDVATLRKRLRKRERTEIHDAYAGYGADFRRRFGIVGEQAIDLFLQTVSMKTVGDLTGFVRSHMLQPFPVEERIAAMIRHFDDLTRAHGEVVKVRRQIELLTPIVVDCDRHSAIAREAAALVAARAALSAYMAERLCALINERIAGLDTEMARLAQRLQGLRSQQREVEQACRTLLSDIDTNGGARLSQIAYELQQKTTLRDERKRRAEAYGVLVRAVGIAVAKSADRFADAAAEMSRRLAEADTAESNLQNRRVDQSVALKELRQRHDDLQAEIASLKGRRSNLPAPIVALRERLCSALGITDDTLPFAGELIEVRPEARNWEGAAERLLHAFAQTLLVPARHYDVVAGWVNANHLAARIVYYRVGEDVPALRTTRGAKHALSEKLRLKDDSPLYNWLQREVDKRFDHVCCPSIEQFRRETKAITVEGQIKGHDGRHEKDDRHAIGDRKRYVLGWSNTAKIAALAAEARGLQKSTQAAADALSKIMAEAEVLKAQRDRLQKLSSFQSFSDLDWSTVALDIERLAAEQVTLAEGSDILKALRGKLDEAETARLELADKVEGLAREEAKTSERRQAMLERRASAEQEIEAHPEDLQHAAQFLLDATRAEVQASLKLTIENCDARERELREALQGRIGSRDATLKSLGARIASAMTSYRAAYPDETREIDASVEAAEDYRRMLTALRDEDLPRFEARFKQLLNENAIREVAGFQSKLREEERTIRERIEIINESLHAIDYQAGTYIALEATGTLDIEIREFQQDLRKCTENTLTGSEDEVYAEAKFLEVTRVIERLRGRNGVTDLDKRWTLKVTDVRNWFEFSASERWRADDVEREHYSDSGGKSGGQKEKLAYTILAASLAYQFGIDARAETSRAFHFVMIDEAFGRGSDQAAEFGLDLFRKMGLQLLIATPLQKIHVIEPFVSAVGYVHKESGVEAERSLLRSMTIEEFRRERAARRTTPQLPAAKASGQLVAKAEG